MPSEQRIGIIDPLPSGELEPQIERYLVDFRNGISRIFLGYRYDYEQALERWTPGLIQEARRFDARVTEGVISQKRPIKGRAEAVLHYIDLDSAGWPCSFSEQLRQYYSSLETALETVSDEVIRQGDQYFMEQTYLFRESAAHDMRALFKFFQEAAGESLQEQLCLRSNHYARVEMHRASCPPHVQQSGEYLRHPSEAVQRQLIYQLTISSSMVFWTEGNFDTYLNLFKKGVSFRQTA